MKKIKNNPLAGEMVFGRVPQDVIDHHYRTIIDTIKNSYPGSTDFLLACINALKDKPGYEHIQYAAQCAVMHGWLTVNASNKYEVKES